MIQDPVVEGLEPDAYVLSIHIALLPSGLANAMPQASTQLRPRRPIPCQRPREASRTRKSVQLRRAEFRKTIRARAKSREGLKPDTTPLTPAPCQVRLADRVYPEHSG